LLLEVTVCEKHQLHFGAGSGTQSSNLQEVYLYMCDRSVADWGCGFFVVAGYGGGGGGYGGGGEFCGSCAYAVLQAQQSAWIC
jgi:hypothetical protein